MTNILDTSEGILSRLPISSLPLNRFHPLCPYTVSDQAIELVELIRLRDVSAPHPMVLEKTFRKDVVRNTNILP